MSCCMEVYFEELEVCIPIGMVEEERYGFWGGCPSYEVWGEDLIENYYYSLSDEEEKEANDYLRSIHDELKNVADDDIDFDKYNKDLQVLFRDRAIKSAECEFRNKNL